MVNNGFGRQIPSAEENWKHGFKIIGIKSLKNLVTKQQIIEYFKVMMVDYELHSNL